MATITTELGDSAARFFRWWTGELSGLVPTPIARRFSGRRSRVVVDVSGPDWLVYRDDGVRTKELIRIPEEDLSLESVRGRLRGRLRSLGLQGRAVALRVAPDKVLVRSFVLPAAASGDLRQAIAFQIERKTPFETSDVHFDYRTLRRDADARQIEAMVAIVPRALAEEAVRQAAALGLHATEIIAEGQGEPIAISLPEGSSRRRSVRSGFNLVLAVIAILLLVAAVAIPLEKRRAAADRFDAQVRALKTDAEEAMRLRDEIERHRAALAFLRDRKREQASAVVILGRLTELFPDDVWLLQLHLTDDRVRVSGYAPNASSLVALIDGAEGFDTPRFLSPVTPEPEGGSERFNLSFLVEAPE